MRAAKSASPESASSDTEDIFHMTNLPPRLTGLPMSIWVRPRGNARHDVRIKVNMSHGRQMSIDNTAVVAIRPEPQVLAGRLNLQDARLVAEWIKLNAEAVVGYWNEELDTDELLERLKTLPTP